MSIRVNLLNADEFRAPATVASSISPRTIGIVGAAVAVVLLAIGLVNYRSVTHGLVQAEERWAILEPTYESVQKIQMDKNANDTIAGELAGWNDSAVKWHVPIAELATLVPPDIQLTRLTVKGDVGQVQSTGPKVEGAKPQPAYRTFTIRIDGVADGEFSDQTVIEFVKAIQKAPGYQDWIESVKLQGLQRSTSKNGGENERVFRVDLESKVREML